MDKQHASDQLFSPVVLLLLAVSIAAWLLFGEAGQLETTTTMQVVISLLIAMAVAGCQTQRHIVQPGSESEVSMTRAIARVQELVAVASAEDGAEQQLAAIGSDELRAFRNLEAEDSHELVRVNTTAMRSFHNEASQEVSNDTRLTSAAVRDRAIGNKVRQRMVQWVAEQDGILECNVCFAATSPPDPGIKCESRHYTCRECFCQTLLLGDPPACAPGGKADVELKDASGAVTKPMGSFPCLEDGCGCLLPETEVVKQIYRYPKALQTFTTMTGRHMTEVAFEDKRKADEAAKMAQADMAAASEGVVHQALLLGGGVRCPCGTLSIKIPGHHDQCMHMATSPCRRNITWCYACGGGQDVCPHGAGCDSESIYMHNNEGWRSFGQAGAPAEFHRRRTEAMLQLARQLLGSELWENLKTNRPGLLRVQQGWGSADFDWNDAGDPRLLMPTVGGSAEHKTRRVLAQLEAACAELVPLLPDSAESPDLPARWRQELADEEMAKRLQGTGSDAQAGLTHPGRIGACPNGIGRTDGQPIIWSTQADIEEVGYTWETFRSGWANPVEQVYRHPERPCTWTCCGGGYDSPPCGRLQRTAAAPAAAVRPPRAPPRQPAEPDLPEGTRNTAWRCAVVVLQLFCAICAFGIIWMLGTTAIAVLEPEFKRLGLATSLGCLLLFVVAGGCIVAAGRWLVTRLPSLGKLLLLLITGGGLAAAWAAFQHFEVMAVLEPAFQLAAAIPQSYLHLSLAAAVAGGGCLFAAGRLTVRGGQQCCLVLLAGGCLVALWYFEVMTVLKPEFQRLGTAIAGDCAGDKAMDTYM